MVKTVVKTQNLRRQILRPLSDKIYWCPFPDEIPSEDWADLSLELEEKYAGFFKIYNLSGQKYDYTLYNGIVAEYPLNLDEPPPLSLLKACAQVKKKGRNPRKFARINSKIFFFLERFLENNIFLDFFPCLFFFRIWSNGLMQTKKIL